MTAPDRLSRVFSEALDLYAGPFHDCSRVLNGRTIRLKLEAGAWRFYVNGRRSRVAYGSKADAATAAVRAGRST